MYIATVQIVFKRLQSLSVVSFNSALSRVESFIRLLLVTSASDLPMYTTNFFSVIFGLPVD